MNINSKLTGYSWFEITIKKSGATISTSIHSVMEAKELKEELQNVISDINYYIEMTEKRLKHE